MIGAHWTDKTALCRVIIWKHGFLYATMAYRNKRMLVRMYDPETLRVGYLAGHMVETFIVNEIMKSYDNNCVEWGFHYYRDSEGNEVDLVMLGNGTLNHVECKSGMTYDFGDVKAFSKLKRSKYEIGQSCIVCLTERAYPIRDGVYALPVSSI